MGNDTDPLPEALEAFLATDPDLDATGRRAIAAVYRVHRDSVRFYRRRAEPMLRAVADEGEATQ